jgi:hypothetical protein
MTREEKEGCQECSLVTKAFLIDSYRPGDIVDAFGPILFKEGQTDGMWGSVRDYKPQRAQRPKLLVQNHGILDMGFHGYSRALRIGGFPLSTSSRYQWRHMTIHQRNKGARGAEWASPYEDQGECGWHAQLGLTQLGLV